MRAVVQRVRSASVTVDGQVVGRIDRGLLVLVGVEVGDRPEDAEYLVRKIASLRIFADDQGKMNCDVTQIGGNVLVVSQFTLLGDCRKGNRPSFVRAEGPDGGRDGYRRCCEGLARLGLTVATGEFGADMQVESINDGPVTILIDSRRTF
ncbi:MAG TPA: D-tyrosyl-tRNA(Tyr) deacylase [Planctomycetaceae bacterium]|nr:D-tyrosyl-tRNA(Tyr) deacylase [Planctomycetaceae bacterium]HRF00136.1 D-aminoacyl-tRNA deacylase [Pirellulaceae bacterium]